MRLAWRKAWKKALRKADEEGTKLGAAAERLRLARNLLGLLDDTVIAARFGLSIDEVRALHQPNSDNR